MILRQHISRLPSRECVGLFRKYAWNSARCASVSSQRHQSQPEKSHRTDYLEKYQDKLERKAKEYVAIEVASDWKGKVYQVYRNYVNAINLKLLV